MKNKKLNLLLITILLFVVFFIDPTFATEPTPTPDVETTQGPLFADLITKGSQIFMGMRDIIYVVSGFGIIGVAIGGFFGTINWKWLGAIIIGLMVIASTAAFIEYVTEQEVGCITDTLTGDASTC